MDYKYLLCTFPFFIFLGFLVLSLTLPKHIELIFADEQIGFFDFLLEATGWATEHHITNYLTTYYYSSFLYFSFRPQNTLECLYLFSGTMGVTALYGSSGEVLEQGGRKIMNIMLDGGDKTWFNGYSSESMDDVILSDVIQFLWAPFQSLLFLVIFSKMHEPSSKKLSSKPWYNLLIRWVLWIVLYTPSGFLATIRNSVDGYMIPFGLFANIFLKLTIQLFMFLDDYETIDDVWFHLFPFIYLVVQYCLFYTFGLITSNTVGFLFVFLISIKLYFK